MYIRLYKYIKIDQANQYLANSSNIFRKSDIKWYKKVPFFLMNYVLFNIFKIYCNYKIIYKIK